MNNKLKIGGVKVCAKALPIICSSEIYECTPGPTGSTWVELIHKLTYMKQTTACLLQQMPVYAFLGLCFFKSGNVRWTGGGALGGRVGARAGQ